MQLSKTTRSWSKENELEFRRLVSDDLSNIIRPCLQAYLLPLDEQGRTGASCQIEVKDFDERGITFQHPRPLHDRRALVVLEGPNQIRITAEVDLSWCRFSQRGQYTSGGRFVSLVGKSA